LVTGTCVPVLGEHTVTHPVVKSKIGGCSRNRKNQGPKVEKTRRKTRTLKAGTAAERGGHSKVARFATRMGAAR